nr:Uma2 family endonuclease [Candidatus Sigynarchaeota archaeon]
MVLEKKPVTAIINVPEELLLEGDYVLLKTGVSEKRFWEIADEDSNFELIDGMLVIHSPASTEHEELFKRLFSFLVFYLEKTGEGRVLGSRLIMRLSESWNPEPDIFVVTSKHVKNIKSTRLDGPADIVIEILSKASREIDITKKLPKYLATGVLEVWLIDPEMKRISVHTKTGVEDYVNPDSDEKIKSHVLPGLDLHVTWVWNREKHPLHTIIR